jgi:hypothetical protein
MNKNIRRVRTIRAKFKVGQHVRIGKETWNLKKAPNKISVMKYLELTRLLKEHLGLSIAGTFEQNSHIGSILSGRTYSCAYHRTDHL